MERLTTSIISLLLALSFVNAKANDVPRQNEDIIANYSLDEDDTLRCGIYAALDYCQERQPKVSHFNTIDPKADQYPELNPYLYCAGNPIKYVDPSGEDVWEMDENGHVLNQIKDQTKDAFRMNGKEISFNYGTVKYFDYYGLVTLFLFSDVSSGKEIFKFLSDNSFAAGSLVEYSLMVTQDKSCVVTQYMDKHVSSGLTMRIMNKLFSNILQQYHNHPSSSGPSGFNGIYMGDKKFATIYENVYGSKISWYVYKPLQQKFTEYFPLGIVSYDNEPWELDFIQRTILHTQPKPWCVFDIRPAIFIWYYKQHLNKK